MRKNSNGFTLIELLVVIIVLAIIAFITVPQVQSFSENARKGAAKTSAMKYADSFEETAMAKLADTADYTGLASGYYKMFKILDMGVQVKGKVPSAGWIHVESNQVVGYSLVIDDKYVVTSTNVNKEPTVTEGSESQDIPKDAVIIE